MGHQNHLGEESIGKLIIKVFYSCNNWYVS